MRRGEETRDASAPCEVIYGIVKGSITSGDPRDPSTYVCEWVFIARVAAKRYISVSTRSSMSPRLTLSRESDDLAGGEVNVLLEEARAGTQSGHGLHVSDDRVQESSTSRHLDRADRESEAFRSTF